MADTNIFEYLNRSRQSRKALSVKANSFYVSILNYQPNSTPRRLQMEMSDESEEEHSGSPSNSFFKSFKLKPLSIVSKHQSEARTFKLPISIDLHNTPANTGSPPVYSENYYSATPMMLPSFKERKQPKSPYNCGFEASFSRIVQTKSERGQYALSPSTKLARIPPLRTREKTFKESLSQFSRAISLV
eukprot:CAMPEP_0204907594 /NCGR_PEP_ID=MMETSP1397-20131031/6715_1 /ASSEMBLY_ACC=CAM_ASM_000891 /TAXON_ID=49980 /ORGANISM="Climacostomum Climacostomum virens, Strain Stock W-24" /LENGTH=187 /DNA_ID=CAMNT_0052076811 /DNA_START=131 /DNA_END=691 /DNA_ORIENTATION=-